MSLVDFPMQKWWASLYELIWCHSQVFSVGVVSLTSAASRTQMRCVLADMSSKENKLMLLTCLQRGFCHYQSRTRYAFAHKTGRTWVQLRFGLASSQKETFLRNLLPHHVFTWSVLITEKSKCLRCWRQRPTTCRVEGTGGFLHHLDDLRNASRV